MFLFYFVYSGENNWQWQCTIEGPDDTPYADGFFFITVDFPDDYPHKPPKVRFTTKIYHCNINAKGELCLDMVKEAWKPSYTVADVLTAISTLLEQPNPETPLVPEIGVLYSENKEEHDRTAAAWTAKYAQ